MKNFTKGQFDAQDDLNSNFNEIKQKQMTYNELALLVANKQLTPGSQYILSDYATKYVQPDTNIIKEMAIERLVLTAIDVDKFNTICSSLDYPQDIIYYSFKLNTCEDDLTFRKGFILRRRDESPNVAIDAPLDWRTMVWARWKVNPTQYLVGATLTNYAAWTSGAADTELIYIVGTSLYQAWNNNVPANNADLSVFCKLWDLNDVIKTDIVIGKKSDGTVLTLPRTGNPIDTYTFGANCTRISISEAPHGKYGSVYYLHNNTFGANCQNNTFASASYNNIFGNNKCNLFVKYMRFKNISAVTALENKDCTNTIERRSDGVTVYWSLNASNVPVYTTVA